VFIGDYNIKEDEVGSILRISNFQEGLALLPYGTFLSKIG